ncbi:MAG: hypothetical protein PHS50_03640, partial [Kiritimatiellae bacterium]|nr:hypothetical protein [Kiritimatiellia bacterium]
RGFGAAWHGSGLFNHETHGIHEKEAWFFMKFHVFHGSGFGTTENTEDTEVLGRHGMARVYLTTKHTEYTKRKHGFS